MNSSSSSSSLFNEEPPNRCHPLPAHPAHPNRFHPLPEGSSFDGRSDQASAFLWARWSIEIGSPARRRALLTAAMALRMPLRRNWAVAPHWFMERLPDLESSVESRGRVTRERRIAVTRSRRVGQVESCPLETWRCGLQIAAFPMRHGRRPRTSGRLVELAAKAAGKGVEKRSVGFLRTGWTALVFLRPHGFRAEDGRLGF
jgi:hypothetical protein